MVRMAGFGSTVSAMSVNDVRTNSRVIDESIYGSLRFEH